MIIELENSHSEEEEDDNNRIELNDNNTSFEKLKKIQLLIKEESSLKDICKINHNLNLYNYFFSYKNM